jgi:hypothetical protein
MYDLFIPKTMLLETSPPPFPSDLERRAVVFCKPHSGTDEAVKISYL